MLFVEATFPIICWRSQESVSRVQLSGIITFSTACALVLLINWDNSSDWLHLISSMWGPWPFALLTHFCMECLPIHIELLQFLQCFIVAFAEDCRSVSDLSCICLYWLVGYNIEHSVDSYSVLYRIMQNHYRFGILSECSDMACCSYSTHYKLQQGLI